MVEGNHYFPKDSVKWEFLHESSSHTQTTCPWKGLADYYDIVTLDGSEPDAAWTYHHPKEAASHIADHVAFWKGVKIVNERSLEPTT